MVRQMKEYMIQKHPLNYLKLVEGKYVPISQKLLWKRHCTYLSSSCKPLRTARRVRLGNINVNV